MRKFLDRRMRKDSHVLRQLATTCFVLAGFSFTSLTLFISFYRWQLDLAADKISWLLMCAIFFLLSGEIARDANKVWEYIVAEITYLFSTAILLGVFLGFVVTLPQIHPAAIIIMLLGISFFLLKVAYDIVVVYRTN